MFKTLKQKIAKENGQNNFDEIFQNSSTRHSSLSQSTSLDSSKDEISAIAEEVSWHNY